MAIEAVVHLKFNCYTSRPILYTVDIQQQELQKQSERGSARLHCVISWQPNTVSHAAITD